MSRGKNSGFIVQYTRPDGSVQTAIMRHSEQTVEFTAHNRAFLRLIDADYRPIVGQSGKESIAVKPLNELRRIGFYD